MLDALLALIRLGRIEAAIPQDEKRGSKLMTVWLRVFGGFERAVYPTRIVSAKIEATILQDGHVQSVVRGASFNYPEYAWRPVKVMRGVVIEGEQSGMPTKTATSKVPGD
jgi:hypothetical protein